VGLTGWQEGDRFVTTADQAGTTALRQPLLTWATRSSNVVTYAASKPDLTGVINYAEGGPGHALLKTARIAGGLHDMRLTGRLYDGFSLKRKSGRKSNTSPARNLALMQTSVTPRFNKLAPKRRNAGARQAPARHLENSTAVLAFRPKDFSPAIIRDFHSATWMASRAAQFAPAVA